MKKNILFCIFILMSLGCISQNSFRPVIIDTDGATDDFRALTAFLSVKQLPVLAITTSAGSLTAQQTYEKLNRLLTSLRLEIPISRGSEAYTEEPSWRSTCLQVNWGNKQKLWPAAISVNELMEKELTRTKEKVVYIALGSLRNLADFIQQKKNLQDRLAKVIWYNPNTQTGKGFNYEIDKTSLDEILKAGIKLETIHSLRLQGLHWDNEMVKQLPDSIPSAAMLKQRFTSNEIPHSYMMDELVASYFFYPEWFNMKPDLQQPQLCQVVGIDTTAVKNSLIRIYNNRVTTERNTAFERFPTETSHYQFDVSRIAEQAIKAYGLSEWKACVLTDEIHGHLGVYSIVGAKMGIKARELLNAPLDRINVSSYSGSKPPTSCLIDGLQVSTGATLGLGMMTVPKTRKPSACAVFEYNGKKVKLQLKPEIEAQVGNDLKAGISQYGNLSEGYWKLVRNLCIRYWMDWNRNDIFVIEYLN